MSSPAGAGAGAGAGATPDDNDRSVTVVVVRHVRPGMEAAFEAWLEGIGKAAAAFPGLLGRQIIRPRDAQHPEYVSVFRFDTYENLRRWTESDVRREWLARSNALAFDESHDTILTGLERWFTLEHRPGLPPPPKWKMALVTFGVVYPLAVGISLAFGRWLAPLPLALRLFVVMGAEIPLITWVIMPRVTRLLQRWLYPGIA